METDELIPNVVAIPEEGRLLRRAKLGEADAFVALYDVYGDNLYRYIYFRVLSDVAAEAITSQVFRHAWDHIGEFSVRGKGLSFVAWLYEIARNQVLIYYKVNFRSDAFDARSLLAAADYRLSQEAQDWSPGEAWGNHLRLLTGNIEQSRLQATAAMIMREYLDYLNPRTARRPSPTFNAYTRSWLIRYLRLHEHRPKPSAVRGFVAAAYAMAAAKASSIMPRVDFGSMPLRLAPVYAVLMTALLLTGTAKAQSALPGQPLYGWKRASEQVWLSVSPDPVGTELILADRRLNEWIAVDKDPARSAIAMRDYMSALASLNTANVTAAHVRIVPVLEAHQKKLKDSGLASQPVSTYLQAAVNTTPIVAAEEAAATAILLSVTPQPSRAAPTASALPTLTPLAPTPLPPTATSSATAIPPTATPVPPTATIFVPTPTEFLPTPTDVPPTPTELIPTPTDTPTDVPTEVPTDTPVPTDIIPTPTDTPPADLPQIPNNQLP